MHDFEDVATGECVYMGNSTTPRVMGKGKILLKFTSGKSPSLSNVLYASSLRKNLVFGILLNKARLKPIVGDDKVVIFRNGIFVGKEYLNRSIVLTLVYKTLNGNASTCYIAESVDLWHSRLAYFNYASIK